MIDNETYETELDEAKRGLKILGGDIETLDSFELLGEDEPQSRAIVVVKKTAKTDEKYPRFFLFPTHHIMSRIFIIFAKIRYFILPISIIL